MAATGITRLAIVSAAVFISGEGSFFCLLRWFLRHHARDLRAMESIVQTRRLAWTIARPPRLTKSNEAGFRALPGALPPGRAMSFDGGSLHAGRGRAEVPCGGNCRPGESGMSALFVPTLVLPVLVASWARLDRERRHHRGDGAEKPPRRKGIFSWLSPLLRYSAISLAPCLLPHSGWTWPRRVHFGISVVQGIGAASACNRRTAWSRASRRRSGLADEANGDAALGGLNASAMPCPRSSGDYNS